MARSTIKGWVEVLYWALAWAFVCALIFGAAGLSGSPAYLVTTTACGAVIGWRLGEKERR